MKKSTPPPASRPSVKSGNSTPHTNLRSTANLPVAPVVPGSSALMKLFFGLFLATLLTPLIYSSSTFFGYISERTWYINALIQSMFLVAVCTPGFFSEKLSPLQIAVFLFLVVLLIADGLGVDPIQSFFSGYSRMEGFLLYLHLGLYFFALARVPFPRTYWHLALLLSTTVALLVVVKGYFSTTGWQAQDHRLIATVGNPSFLSGYLLLHLFVVLYLVVQFPAVSRPLKWSMAALALLVLTGGIYLTGTRSAIIGLMASSIYLAVLGLWHRYRTRSRSIGWLVMIMVSVLILFWLARNTPQLQKFPIMYRLTHYSGNNNTLSPRFICWKVALDGLADRPLLGWGQENFSYGFVQNYDPTILLSSDYSWYDRAHNVLLDPAFSAGLVGLLAYLFLWISLINQLRTSKSRLNSLDRGLLGAVFVAYFFFNLFNFDSLLPLQLIFLLLAFIDRAPGASTPPNSTPTWVFISRSVAVSLIACLTVYAVYQPYRTLRALDRQNKMDDILERTRALEAIYQDATGHQLDMADNLESLTLSVLQSSQPEATKQFCYQRANVVMNEQLVKHPTYTRLMTRVVSLYTAGQETDKAIAMCQRINAVEGNKRPPAFIQLGNAYLNKGALPEALKAFEQAHQLYPRWEEPLLYKALVFAVQRDTVQCYNILRTVNTHTLSSRLLFVKQIYQRAGDPHQFLYRLMQTERKEFYTPQVYVEWALSAFDLNNATQMTTAVNSFYNMYFRNRPYQAFKDMIDEGKRGVRPDRLSTLANELSQ